MSVKLKSSVPVYTIVQLLSSFAHDGSIAIIHIITIQFLKKYISEYKNQQKNNRYIYNLLTLGW